MKNRRSEEHSSNLLPNRPGRLLRNLRLLQCRNTSDKVHILRFPYLGASEDLPKHVETDEDRNVNVCDEEVGGVEVEEDGEPVDEDDDNTPEGAPDREIRLQRAIV